MDQPREPPADEALLAEDADSQGVIARFCAGDRGSFEVFYRRYFDRIYNYARLVLGDAELAEEAASQTFADAHDALIGGEEIPGEVRTWLAGIARRCVVELSELRGRPSSSAAPQRQTGDATAIELAAGSSDAALVGLITRLPVREREIVFLFYEAGLPAGEIAELLGCSPNDVDEALARTVARLGELAAPGGGNEVGGRGRSIE